MGMADAPFMLGYSVAERKPGFSVRFKEGENFKPQEY